MVPQINSLDRREHHLRERADALKNLDAEPMAHTTTQETEFEGGWGSSAEKYHMSKAGKATPLGTFHQSDPAYKVRTGHALNLASLTCNRTSSPSSNSMLLAD